MDQQTAHTIETAARLAQRRGNLDIAERYLKRAGVITFGVEYVSCADRECAYLNMGDTYDLTVVQEGQDFAALSWGDWHESAEREYCEENGAINCGYCGEFTPVDSECWHETVCEHCGRYVDNGELPDRKPDDDDDTDDE
jgi:hypothetical protein